MSIRGKLKSTEKEILWEQQYLFCVRMMCTPMFRITLTQGWLAPTCPFLWSLSWGHLLGNQCLPTVWLSLTPAWLSASTGPTADVTNIYSITHVNGHCSELQVQWLYIAHNILDSWSLLSILYCKIKLFYFAVKPDYISYISQRCRSVCLLPEHVSSWH